MIYGRQGKSEEAMAALDAAVKTDPAMAMPMCIAATYSASEASEGRPSSSIGGHSRSIRAIHRRSRTCEWRKQPQAVALTCASASTRFT